MRSLTLFFVSLLLLFPVLAHTKKPPAKRKASAAKPSSTPTKKAVTKAPDERSSLEKASKIEDPARRIEALKKFNEAFPASSRRTESLSLIVTARNDLATVRISAGDIAAAAVLLKDAAVDAPKPVPDDLWSDVLSKIPAKLFFRGARAEAYDAADSLEEKAQGNAAQMLALASFFLTVEDGASARRLAEKVIGGDANSSLGYQTLGLGYRVDLKIADSEIAFAKAVELDPASLAAKRSLAEARRSLGKASDAVQLYREILEKEEGNIPARTGLVLALFDAGKKTEAEQELGTALAANSGNVILLAGAAYWYATHGDGDKAIDYATRAAAADPRYIWSHIALARGFMIRKQPADAERTLFMAQRYGNFPTLNYELASARLAAGYYNDAAEALKESFVVGEGNVKAMVGGRVQSEGKDLSDAVASERQASIFAPTSNDDADTAARLAALLEMTRTIEAPEPTSAALDMSVDRFVSGYDPMAVYRRLFAARKLLDRKIGLAKVIDLMNGAAAYVDKGVDAPAASTAVMAGELGEIRTVAAARGEYVNVPEIPKNVRSSIVRGEIEALSGWASFNREDHAEALVRLRRAVTVLPTDSSWWRTSMWRLGSALAATAKEGDALESYITAYRSAGVADAVRYSMIEALYRRVKGTADGLESRIGPNPVPSGQGVPQPVNAPSPVADSAKPDPVEVKAGPGEPPCILRSSENEPIISVEGNDLSIMIDVEKEMPLDDLTAVSSSPEDLSVKRETIAGVRTKAIFILRSPSRKAGSYTITFELPCGRKELPVTVR